MIRVNASFLLQNFAQNSMPGNLCLRDCKISQGAKFFLGVPWGAEWPDLKKSKNPYAERWSQPTAKISAF